MQAKFLTTTTFAILALSGAQIHADDKVTTIVNGGNIHFTGEIVNATCAVSTESANQTVELGQYRSSKLAKTGDKTPPIPFKIKLVDCDTSIASTAAIAFAGRATDSNPNLLIVNAGANGVSAQNVGIEIADHLSQIIKVDGASFSTAKALINGSNAIDFTARYVATGAATVGEANASTTFVVKYE
jgi:major type 1 subunit fimbrin (pilin)